MPTLLTVRKVRVAIYPNDHPPPHVHALGPGGTFARFELNCPDGPVVLVGQSGFRATIVAEVGHAIAAALPELCATWRTIHG